MVRVERGGEGEGEKDIKNYGQGSLMGKYCRIVGSENENIRFVVSADFE